jgi:hypothetical protein
MCVPAFVLGVTVVHRGWKDREGVPNDVRVMLGMYSSRDMAADAFYYSKTSVANIRVLFISVSHDSNVGIKGINFLLRFEGRDYMQTSTIQDPWHSQERPDPNNQVFVRTAPGWICPDGARPAQKCCDFVRMDGSGHFFAQICPKWPPRRPLGPGRRQNTILVGCLLKVDLQ